MACAVCDEAGTRAACPGLGLVRVAAALSLCLVLREET